MWLQSAMTPTGIRELKNNLSQYIRRVEAGERIAVTAHGRVVAELGPPARTLRSGHRTRFDDLVAAGVVRLPVDDRDPLAHWPKLRLPAGTAAELIDADRGET
jgi:antitoxin (DNA-binding transcriptional repressor) of toxin-antitoxin stability system